MPTKTSTGRGAKVAPAARTSARTSDAIPATDPAAEALALDRRLAALDSLEDRLLEIARSVPGRVTFSTSLGIRPY
jgi:phosphoadenosine phosphosulfate reductase